MREGKIFLVQGDTSMGVRLPLASLPYIDPKELEEEEQEPDPMAAAAPLPPHAALPGPGQGRSPGRGIRTALTVQSRGGLLYIYRAAADRSAEDWLARCWPASSGPPPPSQQPVVLEGYKAPFDRRLESVLRHARPRRDRGQRAAR